MTSCYVAIEHANCVVYLFSPILMLLAYIIINFRDILYITICFHCVNLQHLIVYFALKLFGLISFTWFRWLEMRARDRFCLQFTRTSSGRSCCSSHSTISSIYSNSRFVPTTRELLRSASLWFSSHWTLKRFTILSTALLLESFSRNHLSVLRPVDIQCHDLNHWLRDSSVHPNYFWSSLSDVWIFSCCLWFYDRIKFCCLKCRI